MYVVISLMVIFLRVQFLLNHEDISSVLHIGFINETEVEFQKLFKKKLKKSSDSFKMLVF